MFTASDISWNQHVHVDRITAKANRVLGLIKRTRRDLNDADIVRALYCSLARPLLEYSCETWNPYTKHNIRELKNAHFRDADGNRKRRFRVLGPYCLPDFYTTHL